MLNTRKTLPKERVVLVGLDLTDRNGRLPFSTAASSPWTEEESLEELALLVDTAGGEVVDRVIQRRDRIDPAYFIGQGKALTLQEVAARSRCDLVVFDDDLSPRQARNLEELIGVRVVDRSELILDIFGQRARTAEAKAQVELARLQYQLPRLRRLWTHLERQVGGIGVRGGPGERQIEVDRRTIQRRITQLRRQLEGIEDRRALQRQRRGAVFQTALVGYTNVGKSTIFNKLAAETVRVQDRLFATLDATTRRIPLDGRHEVLLTDTVGFIKKLPHHLIASFRATLEEVLEADLLLHVVDASHPLYEEQTAIVKQVLSDLGAHETESLLVFNKIDRLAGPEGQAQLEAAQGLHPGAVFVSAHEEGGLEPLREHILRTVQAREVEAEVTLSLDRLELLPDLYGEGEVLDCQYFDDRAVLRLRIDRCRINLLDRRAVPYRLVEPQPA